MKLKKTGLVAKIVILIIALYALVSLLSLRSQLEDYKNQLTDIQLQTEQQRRENEELRSVLDAYAGEEGMESVARDGLGLVDKDEIIFYDVSK